MPKIRSSFDFGLNGDGTQTVIEVDVRNLEVHGGAAQGSIPDSIESFIIGSNTGTVTLLGHVLTITLDTGLTDASFDIGCFFSTR